MDARQYTAACDLPECLADLWVAEVRFDETGEPVFNVENLVTVLWTNDVHAGRGWSAGYVVFAICPTAERAHAACDVMRKKQRTLRELRQDDEQREQSDHKSRVRQAVGDFQRRRGGRRARRAPRDSSTSRAIR